MEIIYQGRDIARGIEAVKVDVTDTAGGVADSLEMAFADSQGYWSQWKPQKGDTVEVREKGFSSGNLYVDTIEQYRGAFLLKALSIPPVSKNTHTKSWENIRFLAMANELAAKYGFQLKTYGVTNWLYQRVDQLDRTDFDFLSYRCILEGYALKISNRSIVIYNESGMEKEKPVITINVKDMDGNYKFKNKGDNLYRQCVLEYSNEGGMIRSSFIPGNAPNGPVLKVRDVPAYNQAEADRYCMNLLRFSNKPEHTGKLCTELNTHLAAGNMIGITGVGFGDGKYFVVCIVHRLVEKKSILRLRRPLGGY